MGRFTDEVLQRLTRIESQLERNTDVLAEHHRRSTQLEERVKPIEDHVKFLRGLMKTLAILAPMITALVALIRFLKGL